MKTLSNLNPVLKDGVLLGEAFNLGGINYQLSIGKSSLDSTPWSQLELLYNKF